MLLVEPYKSEILPYWRFKTPDLAQESAAKIYALFETYRAQQDFVGMDMARKSSKGFTTFFLVVTQNDAPYFCPMVSMERLTPADAALLARMGGKSLIESHGHSAPGETMQAYAERSFSEEACRAELGDQKNIFSAVFSNGQPAGYSKIILATPHPAVTLQPVTKLERLYLLKAFYGLELGHRLLQEAIALSKENGDKGVWLEVWKGNDRAIRFYKKQGFKTVGETEFVLTETHTTPAWVMLLAY